MDKKIIKFGDTEIEKHKFHQHKSPFSLNNIDINIMAVSNKVSFGKKGFKYFINYNDGEKVRPSCILLPCRVHIEQILMKQNTCYFLIKHHKLLQK